MWQRKTCTMRRLNALAVEKSALETRVNALETLGPAQGTPVALELQSKKDRLAQVTADLLATPEITVPVTQGFIRDLMSESGEISFHRLQIAAWTIVLGAIFLVTCYSSIVMPSFDNTLLVLMGISSGTYLGFKLPSDKG